MLKAQVDEQVREEIAAALRVHRTGKAPWLRQDVGSCFSQAYEVESSYIFLSEQQFREKFGMAAAAAAGARIDEIQDEFGRPCRGVALQDPDHMFRRVRVLSRFECHMSEELLKSQEQLRAQQGQEMFAHYKAEHAKQGRSFLRLAPLTVQAMERLAEEKKQVAGELAATAVAPPVEAAEEPVHNPSTSILNPNDDHDAQEEEESGAPLLESFLGRPEDKKRGRNSGGKGANGRGAGSKKQPRKTQAKTCNGDTPTNMGYMSALAAPRRAEESGGGVPQRSRSPPRVKEELRSCKSEVESRAAGGSGSSGKSAKNLPDPNKVSYWISTLDLSTILSGAAKGNELYQARRVRDCLQKTAPHSLDLVLLQAHLEKCIWAQKLVSTKDAVALEDEVTNARVFTRLVVNECLIPLVMQGERQRHQLHAVLRCFRGMLHGLPDMGPVFQAATKAVLTCMDCVWALLEPLQSTKYIGQVDVVTEAREGAEHLLRQALSQSALYKGLLQDLRAHQVAHAQFAPRVEAAAESLGQALQKKAVTLEALRLQVPELVSWRSALRSGSTKHLEAIVVKCFLELESDCC